MRKLMAVAVAMIAAGCNFGWVGVRGDGTSATAVRTLGEFDEVETAGSFDVEISPGPQAVTVVGETNLLPMVTTTLRGRTLVISSTGSMSPTRRLAIVVTHPGLKRLGVSGSGAATLTGVEVDSLALAVSGSGSITATGRVKTLDLAVSGSGSVSAAELVAQDAKAAVSGSGDVLVNAANSLTAAVAGSGDVRYVKRPAAMQSQVSGSGSVGPK